MLFFEMVICLFSRRGRRDTKERATLAFEEVFGWEDLGASAWWVFVSPSCISPDSTSLHNLSEFIRFSASVYGSNKGRRSKPTQIWPHLKIWKVWEGFHCTENRLNPSPHVDVLLTSAQHLGLAW